MTLKKKDFIEIKFTGKVKDGEIFDSNIKEDLEKANLDIEARPFIFCLGEGMFLEALDNFLMEKNLGEYEIELEPEKAFGKRDSGLVKMVPMKIFREQKINPVPGVMFNFDGRIAKILTVSGGRVMVDFNNALAGKEVNYKINVLRKVDDLNEKIKALNEFFFKKDLKFEVKDKKIILEIEKQLSKFAELFKDKYKEILGLDLELKEIEGKILSEDTDKEENTKTHKKSQ
jgi:FKBP-type peptidyl-prolyl cis-trans isomerase 2